MEGNEQRPEAEPRQELGSEEAAEAQAQGATPEVETLAEPPQGGRRYALTAGIAAAVVVVGAALFVAGFWTHSLLDDDVDLKPVEQKLVALETRTGQIEQILSGAVASGNGGSTSPGAATSSAADDDPAWGPKDASLVMVEFSDFQCPFCRRFATETLPSIRETYGDKVRYIYRDFPLSQIHPYAQKAAEAGQCAEDQGKFWEYHDLIFENQDQLNGTLQSEGLNAVLDSFKTFATDLGLDSGQFNDCLDSGKHQQEVLTDMQDGRTAGISGTPGFLIKTSDGQYVSVEGAQPFEQFQQVLDQLLAAEG